ncbi:MAG TPA: DUF1269 domain-containing protein [Candidatus Eremiobacteraceae bacterium]|nr:DUF1269 domain-containing protein [Candidatus Eremiobacteraceae bacterium]
MSSVDLIVLMTNSKDGAATALETARRLDCEHWIELMDYALISKDEKGRITVHELDDEHSEKVAAAVTALAGAIAGGGFGGPAGAVTGAAVGAVAGAGSIRLTERLVRDTYLETPDSFANNSSALAVVVDERYAEQLEEELQKLGRITRKEMKRAEREAELNAYVERSKAEIESLQTKIKTKLANAKSATQAEKAKLDTEIAADRAELDFKREKLEDHIKAISSDLKSDIRETKFRLELAGLAAKDGIASSLDSLHRLTNHLNDELQQIIEDQIDTLKEEGSELKAKAINAKGEAKTAIENHLAAVEVRLRRKRAKMIESFKDRLLQAKQWFEILQVRSALGKADLRDKLQAAITTAQHKLAQLKANARARKQEDERAWKDIRTGFNEAWKDLADALDRAHRERA